nr:glycosyltransferase [Paenibacillus xylanexedens]
MNIQHILNRINHLNEEEKALIALTEKKEISLFQEKEWFSSSPSLLIQNESLVSTEDIASYLSFQEQNNSYELSPKNSIFTELPNELVIEFYGNILKLAKVSLYIITYKNKKKSDVFVIPLNSTQKLSLALYDSIRIALRIEGKGSFKLKNLVLQPVTIETSYVYQEIENFNPQIQDVKELKIAMIADEFTYESFKNECDVIYLSPKNWKETMIREKPRVFFCESAWSGKDPLKREWKGKIYSSINFKSENRTELLEILQYCKTNKIKTVFWNKEDPSHYEDKVHNFIDTALRFDYIFTTAYECVDRYKSDYGHPNTYPLMFAVQPAQFNPIDIYKRTDDFIFAGSFYRQHPDRSIAMESLFDLLLKANRNLIIYDRHYYFDDENHTFPDKYNGHIQPSIPYTLIDKAYKGSDYAININTETNSKTMFARRVFELIASNTIVISNYSKGMDEVFGDLVFMFKPDDPTYNQNTLQRLDTVDRNVLKLKALRYVLKYHTYNDRLHYILEQIGLVAQKREPSVLMIVKAKDEYGLLTAISLFSQQTYQNKKLLIINTMHDSMLTSEWLRKYSDESIFITDLNMLTNYTVNLEDFMEGIDYFTLPDSNYYYGNQYLSDMIISYKYLNKQAIVVKDPSQSQYQYVSNGSLHASVFPATVLRYIDVLSNDLTSLSDLHKIGYQIFNIDHFNILFPETNIIEMQSKINI